MKSRVTATLWEDEGSLCFQVEAKGVCVARREDNHFINGTKLLNVAGMTRGRRDGILKSEKIRHVVKIGPMHLKGVWIPFDRALEFANKEKITDIMYPLFVHNIGALLYNPENTSKSGTELLASSNAGPPQIASFTADATTNATTSRQAQRNEEPQSPTVQAYQSAGSGRSTPRLLPASQPQWGGEYRTPPQSASQSSYLHPTRLPGSAHDYASTGYTKLSKRGLYGADKGQDKPERSSLDLQRVRTSSF